MIREQLLNELIAVIKYENAQNQLTKINPRLIEVRAELTDLRSQLSQIRSQVVEADPAGRKKLVLVEMRLKTEIDLCERRAKTWSDNLRRLKSVEQPELELLYYLVQWLNKMPLNGHSTAQTPQK